MRLSHWFPNIGKTLLDIWFDSGLWVDLFKLNGFIDLTTSLHLHQEANRVASQWRVAMKEKRAHPPPLPI